MSHTLIKFTFCGEPFDRSDSGWDDDYDGRIHSLTHEKYDPYQCPRCNGIFDTSQKFASHMKSHYKSETKNERDHRFRARNKKDIINEKNEIDGKSEEVNHDSGIGSSTISLDLKLSLWLILYDKYRF